MHGSKQSRGHSHGWERDFTMSLKQFCQNRRSEVLGDLLLQASGCTPPLESHHYRVNNAAFASQRIQSTHAVGIDVSNVICKGVYIEHNCFDGSLRRQGGHGFGQWFKPLHIKSHCGKSQYVLYDFLLLPLFFSAHLQY